jgi:hypothetical protein
MIRKVILPPCLPFKFVPSGSSVEGTRYNNNQPDRVWYYEWLQPWEQKEEYERKVQLKDRMSLQIMALTGIITMKLLKCDGTETRSDVFTQIPDPAVIPYAGTDYIGYSFVDNLYWEDIDEGRYYLQLQVAVGADTDLFISEPISVKEYHSGTVLWEYCHEENKDFVIWEQTNQVFNLRVEGAILEREPLVNRSSFIDKEWNTYPLKATAYRGWTFWVGGDAGNVPDYIIDCMNAIFTLTSTRYEGKGYVPADGAAIEKVSIPRYPLYAAAIELREADIISAYTHIKGSIVLFDVPTYPFVIMNTLIGYAGQYEFVYQEPEYITSDADVLAYIATLTAQGLLQGVDGSFSRVADQVLYELGANETFATGASVLLTKYMSIVSTTPGSGNNLNVNFTLAAAPGAKSGYALIIPNSVVQQGWFLSGITPVNSPYVAGASGTYEMRLFHDDTMFSVSISGDYITSIGGTSPARMQQFELLNCPIITTFSIYTVLSNSKLFLTTLYIHDNVNLVTIENYYYSLIITQQFAMTALRFISLRGNKMNATTLNSLYNNMGAFSNSAAAANLLPSGGIINTGGQVPAAMPTITSSAARANMQTSFGWIIITT